MRKLTLFTDRSFLSKNTGHLELLYPFWGALGDPENWKGLGIYDNYVKIGPQYFTITSNPSIADFALLPNDFKRYEKSKRVDLAKDFVKVATRHGLKTIVFFHSDFDYKIPLKNVIIFRTSLNSHNRNPNEFALPGWNGDLLMHYLKGKLKLWTNKPILPSVGFCGAARPNPLNFNKLLKSYIKKHFFKRNYRFNALQLRFKILKALSNTEYIKTNFIIRDSYLGGASDFSKRSQEELRNEYFHNLISNPYVLCVRGVGNFSYRFYEALSVGRIPILIDTKTVLPFDNLIDWKKNILWVKKRNLRRIDQLILTHYNSMSEDEFQLAQMNARKIWEQYLSPEGFFKHVNLILKDFAK